MNLTTHLFQFTRQPLQAIKDIFEFLNVSGVNKYRFRVSIHFGPCLKD